jgi:hypothetical protein
MICTRLGITESAFATHVKAGAVLGESADTGSPIKPLALDEGIRQLCRLSLIDPDAKAWLAQRPSPAAHELGEGGELLEKILQSPLALHQPPARATFISTLTPQEEIAINLLDLDRPQENTALVAQDHWFGLAAAYYKNLRAAAAAQLHRPELSPAERTGLQTKVAEATKQILDLQSRLNEV